ncbi:PfkB family carbohydrate kinase [Promicromonospora soli]
MDLTVSDPADVPSNRSEISERQMDAALLPVDVAVIGVANVDIVTRVERLPQEGQTVFGEQLETLPGGKGLNQAIAVARQGGRAALVANAGDDQWGHLLLDSLLRAGVDVTAFQLVADDTTAGVLIQVPASGDSAVTVTRARRTLHSIEDIERASALLAEAAVAIVQLELDLPVIEFAIAGATGRVIGTLVPSEPLPRTVLERLDLLVVNAAEAAKTVGGATPRSVEAARRCAEALREKGPSSAVVTMGAVGAAYASEEEVGFVAAPRVDVVDTTGAGDALLGALSLALSCGASLPEALRLGVVAGSQAVQIAGAS